MSPDKILHSKDFARSYSAVGPSRAASATVKHRPSGMSRTEVSVEMGLHDLGVRAERALRESLLAEGWRYPDPPPPSPKPQWQIDAEASAATWARLQEAHPEFDALIKAIEDAEEDELRAGSAAIWNALRELMESYGE